MDAMTETFVKMDGSFKHEIPELKMPTPAFQDVSKYLPPRYLIGGGVSSEPKNWYVPFPK